MPRRRHPATVPPPPAPDPTPAPVPPPTSGNPPPEQPSTSAIPAAPAPAEDPHADFFSQKDLDRARYLLGVWLSNIRADNPGPWIANIERTLEMLPRDIAKL